MEKNEQDVFGLGCYNWDMNAKTLREMLEKRPFQPFEVRMSSGDVYQVRYPNFAFVLRSNFVIGDPDEDHVHLCALDHIASVSESRPTSPA